MAKNKKTTFSVDGKDEKYAILQPTFQNNEDATMEYNRVFSKALSSGALLREKLEQYMISQGIWDEQKEKTQNRLVEEISNKSKSLKAGGIKLSEAKKVALEIRTLRMALQGLIAEKNSLDVNTAQGQAENARFNALLVGCLVYNDTGEPVYENIDKYLSSEDGVAVKAAEVFAGIYYGLDKNYEKNLPENKFLNEYEFTDDENRLVNSEGQLIDFDGKLIDSEGRFVNEDGEYVNIDGERVDEEGNPIVAFSPFLDEDGNEVFSKENPQLKEAPKKTTKRRGRPKKSDSEKTEQEAD